MRPGCCHCPGLTPFRLRGLQQGEVERCGMQSRGHPELLKQEEEEDEEEDVNKASVHPTISSPSVRIACRALRRPECSNSLTSADFPPFHSKDPSRRTMGAATLQTVCTARLRMYTDTKHDCRNDTYI